MRKNSLDLEKENMEINIPSTTCTNQVKQYTKEVETSKFVFNSVVFFLELLYFEELLCYIFSDPGATGKGIEQRSESTMSSKSTRSNTTKSSSQEMQKMDRNPLVSEKDDKQINISLPPSTDQVMKHSETIEKGMIFLIHMLCC